MDRRMLETWELIKNKYSETLILIPPKWDMEFHVHTCIIVGYGGLTGTKYHTEE
jgi:hypothetical protein